MESLRSRPLAWALLIYTFAFAVEAGRAMLQTAGRLIYPLDDAYMSMALAKNFALHGVWGITRFAFTSATSTPLYDLLLAAAYRITGATEWWPLVLAFCFGALTLAIADQYLPQRRNIRLAGLFGIALLTPLATMAHTGMEHTLHIYLTLLFAFRASRAIADGRPMDWALLIIAPLLVMTRFEGLFIATACIFLLLVRGSVWLAGILALATATPVVAYGAISISKGWFFLPNSLLLKGIRLNPDPVVSACRIVFHVWDLLCRAPHLIGLPIALAALLWVSRSSGGWARERILLWLAFASIAGHLMFADVGWVFRYEAYLIALSVFATGVAWPLLPRNRSRRFVQAIVSASALILLVRSVRISQDIPEIAASIFSQQYQMARFVSGYYPSGSIAANDIGAIDYFADLHLLDLMGLADSEVLRQKRRGTYTTEAIGNAALAKATQIAIVYDDWFAPRPTTIFGGPPLPLSWTRVSRWRLPGKLWVGSDTVSFYAVREEDQAYLSASLRAFEKTLPARVVVLR